MMTGAMMENGILKIEAKSGTQVSTTNKPAKLPRYILAINPQTKSGFSTKSSGPGCKPQINKPPSNTAAVGEPGIPKDSIGNNAAVPAACAAVSGATIPSILPVPKLSPSLDTRFATPYAINEAGVAPPGVIPIQQPIKQLRNEVAQYFGNCFQVSQTTLARIFAAAPLNAKPSSIESRISPIPNKPITAIKKSKPRINSGLPKVKRN